MVILKINWGPDYKTIKHIFFFQYHPFLRYIQSLSFTDSKTKNKMLALRPEGVIIIVIKFKPFHSYFKLNSGQKLEFIN